MWTIFLYCIQVVLEVFTGLMPYSKERDECCLSDHCEETLGEQEAFRSISDKKAGNCDPCVSEQFRMVSKCCIPRNYKKRCSMATVLQMWEDFMKKKSTSVQPAKPKLVVVHQYLTISVEQVQHFLRNNYFLSLFCVYN